MGLEKQTREHSKGVGPLPLVAQGLATSWASPLLVSSCCPQGAETGGWAPCLAFSCVPWPPPRPGRAKLKGRGGEAWPQREQAQPQGPGRDRSSLSPTGESGWEGIWTSPENVPEESSVL